MSRKCTVEDVEGALLRELAEHEAQAVSDDVVALARRPLEHEAVQVVVFCYLYGLLYLP
jgi:hypothetical protein